MENLTFCVVLTATGFLCVRSRLMLCIFSTECYAETIAIWFSSNRLSFVCVLASDMGLSIGAIVGICVAVTCFLFLVAGAVVFSVHRRRKALHRDRDHAVIQAISQVSMQAAFHYWFLK